MIYKLIILIASIFMIYEFTKSRSTAIAQIEPRIIKTITDTPRGYSLTLNPNIQTIANNQESFKRWFARTTNSAKPYATWNLFDANGVLDPYILNQIQKYDTEFFAWRNSVSNAWLQLNGV